MTTDARAPLLLSVALLLLCGADAHAGERARRLIEQAHRLTEKRFYDKARLRRAQWKRLGAEYAARAEALSDEEPVAARRLLNKMLGELETSHLVAVEGRVFQRSLRCELDDTRPPRLGLELVEVEGRLHAARLLEGGAAARAGVRAGDEVVHIDGVAPRRCPALHDLGHDPGLPGPSGYTLLVEEGQAVALDLRAAPTALSHSVTLRARPDNMIDASARSARIIPWRGRKLGYLHLWHFLHKRIIAIYRAALEDTFADAEGLVLDVRGRGGYSQLGDAILDSLIGEKRSWNRPVVLLIDRDTRSAKEIFAWRWRARKPGPMIGERTAGACLGTIFLDLEDGSKLLMPGRSSERKTGGVQLEGRGVEPDLHIDAGSFAWRDRDAILEGGLDALHALLPKPARRAPARLYQRASK